LPDGHGRRRVASRVSGDGAALSQNGGITFDVRVECDLDDVVDSARRERPDLARGLGETPAALMTLYAPARDAIASSSAERTVATTRAPARRAS
jgi:hypothetical protein